MNYMFLAIVAIFLSSGWNAFAEKNNQSTEDSRAKEELSSQIDLRPYLISVNNRLQEKVSSIENIPGPLEISFRIDRQGDVYYASVEKSCGDENTDDAAWSAVESLSPLPILPFPRPYPGYALMSANFDKNSNGKTYTRISIIGFGNDSWLRTKSYMDRLTKKLKHKWYPPRYCMLSDTRVVLMFKIHKDGSVSDLKVLKSPNKPLADAAIKAVKDAAPLEPPIDHNDETDIQFTFGPNLYGYQNAGVSLFRRF